MEQEQPAAQEQPAQPQGPMDMFIAFSRAQLVANGFERHEATINDHRMVWWEKGDGEVMVMVHGVSDQAGTWFQVAPALAESHRVLLVDLPGHGDSEPESGPLPMTTVVDGLVAWLLTHAAGEGEPGRDRPVTLVGNSMGAWLVLLAAERHPERVARLVVTNGGPLRADTGDLNLLPANREEARRLMAALRDPSNLKTPEFVLDDLVRRVPTGQVTRMFEAMEDLESYLLADEALGRIATPVDVLWGESDRYLGREYPDRLVAGLPHARLTLVSKCGHIPQAECPERYLEQLVEVLAMAPPGRDSDAATPSGDTGPLDDDDHHDAGDPGNGN